MADLQRRTCKRSKLAQNKNGGCLYYSSNRSRKKIYSVVDLDLFVSGSVFRDGTDYPPKSMCGLRDVSHHLIISQTRRIVFIPYIFIVFTFLYRVLAPGSWVNIPYDYDSPVAALSAELLQALFIYYVLLYVIITTHIYSHVCCSDHSQNNNSAIVVVLTVIRTTNVRVNMGSYILQEGKVYKQG